MPKILNERVFDLRDWQAEAFRKIVKYVQDGKVDFLCVATPGSGKTRLGLRVAHYLMKESYCDRVVVVTPTDSLKRQWAANAATYSGLDIDPDFTNNHGIEAEDYHGIAITYSLLGMDKKGIHAQNTFNKRTFVILDEPHHMGESLNWGDSAVKAFEGAVFRLSISGTAFRSDDNPIPFIKYENRMSVADYNYSYDRAIRENVCRPVYFSIYDGKMKWKVSQQEFEHTFTESLAPDQVSKRLKTALDPKGNWVRDIIKAADIKLTEIRRTHHDAAALVFAATQKHAKEIAKVIEELTGVLPPVVVSEETDSNGKIDHFRSSTDRWLVSVKMVSEGVDIPRLRVGVYFTIVKAELFFRQAVGRFVRVLSHLQWQDAFVFMPQDREIVKLAESIQEERDHALDEAKKAALNGEDGDLFGSDYTPALTGKFVPLGSEATGEKTIAVTFDISTGMKESIHKSVNAESPVYLQKENLRTRLNQMAKRIALRQRNGNSQTKPDWKFAHKKWIDFGGKEMELETVKELESRVQFYKNLLRSN